MSPLDIFDILALTTLVAIAILSKDRVVSGIAYLYSFTHLWSIKYDATSWLDLCLEAGVCLGLGLAIISQSTRTWAVSLAVILIMSIALITIEFIDYFAFNSYFEAVYIQWIYATTFLEIIILAMATNGLLHNYTDGFWANIHHIVRDSFNKVSTRQA